MFQAGSEGNGCVADCCTGKPCRISSGAMEYEFLVFALLAPGQLQTGVTVQWVVAVLD